MKLIAYTGTHGTGKTTSVFERAREEKIANPDKKVGIICENAAFSPFPINTKTTHDSQLWIFTSQLCKEIEMSQKYDILICDRTICDSIAYTVVAGFADLYDAMMKMAEHHITRYNEISFKTVEKNDWLHADGLRDAANTNWRMIVESKLKQIYTDLSKKYNINIKYI